jgi:cellulose synthase/poly-beta-1,6-N-acetylglucosamine synthase-like glycosyltransferase
MQKPLISLIVAVYKNVDALQLIFLSLEQQSFKNFEVIVAEDNNSPEMAALIANQQQKNMFPLKHVYQDDLKFRKNKIFNTAIRVSSGLYCVFLDGDCIPHRHFLKQYSKCIKDGVFCAGRRVMLSQKLSKNVLESQNLAYLSFLNCMQYGVEKYLKRALYLPWLNLKKNVPPFYLLGCNMGGCKSDLLAINGFDEDYELPGVGEDLDLDWRLRASGVSIKVVSYQCVTYHLYHKMIYDPNNIDQINNRAMMTEKEKVGNWRCINGLKKL